MGLRVQDPTSSVTFLVCRYGCLCGQLTELHILLRPQWARFLMSPSIPWWTRHPVSGALVRTQSRQHCAGPFEHFCTEPFHLTSAELLCTAVQNFNTSDVAMAVGAAGISLPFGYFAGEGLPGVHQPVWVRVQHGVAACALASSTVPEAAHVCLCACRHEQEPSVCPCLGEPPAFVDICGSSGGDVRGISAGVPELGRAPHGVLPQRI